MLQGIDHVVVAVNDLARTMHDYEHLGFTVTPGGDHAHRGSHNALITFADGSYIELIAFKHEPLEKDNDWWDVLQNGEGLVDVALLSDDLPAEAERLRVNGLDVTLMEGGRVRTDGIRVGWRIARLPVSSVARLPFVIDDLTERTLRVPVGAAARHANGVIGIARVTIAMPSLPDAAAVYRHLLGEPVTLDDGFRFEAGAHTVDLVSAGSATTSRPRFPQEVTLCREGESPDTLTTLDRALTHGANLTIEERAPWV
jgi:catechol 2,3-dioxygenase-like lactoylglutathione lyase family enzyme